MIEKFSVKFNIEQLIRYILIGVIDSVLVLWFFSFIFKGNPQYKDAISAFAKDNSWFLLLVPALGFTHYLIHRFFFFMLFDSLSYAIRTAPWSKNQKGCRLKALILKDYKEKADFVNFRNEAKDDYRDKDGKVPLPYEKYLSRSLSSYLFYRWAAVHYILMILEAFFIFSYFSEFTKTFWITGFSAILVVFYGAMPMHLYEKRYYAEYLRISAETK